MSATQIDPRAVGVRELSIFGLPVSLFESYADAVEAIRLRIALSRRTACFAVNPLKTYRAMQEPALMRALNAADIRICDGIGVSWAGLALHRKWVPRVTGIQLFFHLIEASVREGWKIFLLGASPESNAAAASKLVELYPGLQIAGTQDGFFKNSSAVVQSINDSGADLLFVAMGSPRQELWITEHMPGLRTAFCMGIGGTLDTLSGEARWAPGVFRATGTEWLFRIVTQPRRLGSFRLALLFALEVLRATPRYMRSASRG